MEQRSDVHVITETKAMCGSSGQKIVEFKGENGVNSILNQYHRDPMLTFQRLSVIYILWHQRDGIILEAIIKMLFEKQDTEVCKC